VYVCDWLKDNKRQQSTHQKNGKLSDLNVQEQAQPRQKSQAVVPPEFIDLTESSDFPDSQINTPHNVDPLALATAPKIIPNNRKPILILPKPMVFSTTNTTPIYFFTNPTNTQVFTPKILQTNLRKTKK
jgi:hypothetical protein